MSGLRWGYLVLTLLGAILPMTHFIRWFEANGYDLGLLVAAWTVSDATTGLVWDLSIAAIALGVFIVAEVLVRRDWWVLFCLPLILLVGVGFALPLYLFLRARTIR